MIIPEWNSEEDLWECPDCGQTVKANEDSCQSCREDIDWES